MGPIFFFKRLKTAASVVLSVVAEQFVFLCVGGSVLVLEVVGFSHVGAAVHCGKSSASP